jgi:Flp pilus assembly pilin Flp
MPHRNWLKDLAADERGMETVEWGVLSALVVLIGVSGLSLLGPAMARVFGRLTEAITV